MRSEVSFLLLHSQRAADRSKMSNTRLAHTFWGSRPSSQMPPRANKVFFKHRRYFLTKMTPCVKRGFANASGARRTSAIALPCIPDNSSLCHPPGGYPGLAIARFDPVLEPDGLRAVKRTIALRKKALVELHKEKELNEKRLGYISRAEVDPVMLGALPSFPLWLFCDCCEPATQREART